MTGREPECRRGNRLSPDRAAVRFPSYGHVLWAIWANADRLLELDEPDPAALERLCVAAEEARQLGDAILNDCVDAERAQAGRPERAEHAATRRATSDEQFGVAYAVNRQVRELFRADRT